MLFIFVGGIRCSSPMTAFVKAQDKMDKALQRLMLFNDTNDKNDSVFINLWQLFSWATFQFLCHFCHSCHSTGIEN